MLDADQELRLTAQLADVSLRADVLGPCWQGIRAAVGAVVAQRSGVQVIGFRRWRWHTAQNGALMSVQTPAIPYVLAGGAPSLETGFTLNGPFAGIITAGAAAFVGLAGLRLPAAFAPLPVNVDVPAGVPVFFCAVSDNTATDTFLLISQVPAAS